MIMELDITCNSTINVQGKLVPQGEFFSNVYSYCSTFKSSEQSPLQFSQIPVDTDSVSKNGCIDIYCSSYSLALKDASSLTTPRLFGS